MTSLATTNWRIPQLTTVVLVLLGGWSCAPRMVDVAASGLSAAPTVIDTSPAPSDGKVPVLVQFLQSGAAVQLASNASITCNGVPLPWNGLAYAARVPLVAPGGTLAIVHSRAGVTSQINVTVPPRPVVTAPAGGGSVARSPGLVIHYVAGTSAGVTPGAGDAATGVSGTEQPDNGTATLDVTALKPGAGTVSVSRRIVASPGGTGFASVTVTYHVTSASVHVTWQ